MKRMAVQTKLTVTPPNTSMFSAGTNESSYDVTPYVVLSITPHDAVPRIGEHKKRRWAVSG